MDTSEKKNSIYVTKIILFFISSSFLMIGGILYLLFRPHNLEMFNWLDSIRCEKYFNQHNFNSNSKIISFCIFSLPNGLWLLSAIILLGLIWKNNKHIFYIYALLFVIISLAFELFQLLRIIPGTFDFLDIITLVISFLLGIIIYHLIIQRYLV